MGLKTLQQVTFSYWKQPPKKKEFYNKQGDFADVEKCSSLDKN